MKTLAGSSKGGVDGKKGKGRMYSPFGIVFNPLDDCLYVCDSGNDLIRRVSLSGNINNYYCMKV